MRIRPWLAMISPINFILLQCASAGISASLRFGYITLDDHTFDVEGVICSIANSGNFLPGVSLAPGLDVSDGLLDVIIVRSSDLASLLAMASSMLLTKDEKAAPLQHWQAREITVSVDPPQPVQADSEIIGQTPISAKVLPQAVYVMVPAV